MKRRTNSLRDSVTRRGFIRGSLAALASLDWQITARSAATASQQEENPVKIREYRTLGRTGFKCSDIACGSGDLTDPALGAAILDAGINYIDTAENYRRGQIERTIGKAVQNRDRKKIFISTKLGLFGDFSKRALKDRALKCLERLDTEYIDCLMIHMPSSVEQLKTEGFHAAVQELKAEGKVRFAGLSNHGSQWRDEPEPMEKIHLAAAEDGRFDVALLVYNFLQKEESERILRVYKQKNIGATIMKSNPVLNYLEMKESLDRSIESGRDVPERVRSLVERLKKRADLCESFKTKYNLTDFDSVRDAAIKFVLDNPNVSCVCPTIKNYADVEFYVGLSGKRFDLKAQKESRHASGDKYQEKRDHWTELSASARK